MPLFTLFLLLTPALGQKTSYENFRNQTTDAAFSRWLDTANASTSRTLDFPDIHNSSYPSTGTQIDYKAWLFLTQESTEGGLIRAGFHPDERFIYDNGSLARQDDSWLTCLDFTRFRKARVPRDEPVHANCSNVFPEDCVAWLEDLSADGRLCLNASRLTLSPWKDSPCDGALDGQPDRPILRPAALPIAHLQNLTVSASSLREDMPAESRYDYFVDSAYLLVAGFAKGTYGYGNERATIDEDAPTVRSRFVFMRADRFSEGSRTLDDISPAARLHSPNDWAVAIGAAAAVILVVGII